MLGRDLEEYWQAGLEKSDFLLTKTINQIIQNLRFQID